MTETIRIHFVATGDLTRLQNQVDKLNASVRQFNKGIGTVGPDVIPASALSKFNELVTQGGHFKAQMANVRTDADKFGDKLAEQKLSFRESVSALRNMRSEMGVINQLAKRNVAMQQSIVQDSGVTRSGQRAANVVSPTGMLTSKEMKTVFGKDFNTDLAFTNERMRIINESMRQGSESMINWGKNTQWAGRQMMVGLSIPLSLLGGAAAATFYQMDKELVRIQKVYGSGLTFGDQFKEESLKIREASIELAENMAKSYGQAIDQTLKLTADIAATGKEGAELMASVEQTTRLATLGELDRQEAMKATLSLQTAFKMNTEELTKSVNFLNAVENQTSTNLQDLVEAIPRAGATVKSLGGSIEDLSLYMVALREGGIEAGEGANALKSGLAAIIAPSKVASDYAASLGVNLQGIVDANKGDLTGMLIDLQESLSKLDDVSRQEVIAKVFGRYQMNRWSALLANLGAEGSQTAKVLDLVNTSASALAQTADQELAAVMESASGQFNATLQTLRLSLAQLGEGFLGPITALLKGANALLEAFNGLGDTTKGIIKFGLIFAGVVGPIVMTMGVLGNFLGYIVKLGLAMNAFISHRGIGRFKAWNAEMAATSALAEQLSNPFYDATAAIETMTRAIEVFGMELAQVAGGNLGNLATRLPNLTGTTATSATGTVMQSRVTNEQSKTRLAMGIPESWTTAQLTSAQPGYNPARALAGMRVSQMFMQPKSELRNMLLSGSTGVTTSAGTPMTYMQLLDAAAKSTDPAALAKYRKALDEYYDTIYSSQRVQDILKNETAEAAKNLNAYANAVQLESTAVGGTGAGGTQRREKVLLSGMGSAWNEGLAQYGAGPAGQREFRALSPVDFEYYKDQALNKRFDLWSEEVQAGHMIAKQDVLQLADLQKKAANASESVQGRAFATAEINRILSNIGIVSEEAQQEFMRTVPAMKEVAVSSETLADARKELASVTKQIAASEKAKATISSLESRRQGALTNLGQAATMPAQLKNFVDPQTGKFVSGQRKILNEALKTAGLTQAESNQVLARMKEMARNGQRSTTLQKVINEVFSEKVAVLKSDVVTDKRLSSLKGEEARLQSEVNSMSQARKKQIDEQNRALREKNRISRMAAKIPDYGERVVDRSLLAAQGFGTPQFEVFSRVQSVASERDLARSNLILARQRVADLKASMKATTNAVELSQLQKQLSRALVQQRAAQGQYNAATRALTAAKIKSTNMYLVGVAVPMAALGAATKRATTAMNNLVMQVRKMSQSGGAAKAGMALGSLSAISMFTGNNDGTSAKATAINALSMAGMGAGMGMMLGPIGAAVGGTLGGLAGAMQKTGEAARNLQQQLVDSAKAISEASRATDEMIKTLGASKDEIDQREKAESSAGLGVLRQTGFSGVSYQAVFNESRINEIAEGKLEQFREMTSEQALRSATLLYQNLIAANVPEASARVFIKDLLTQAEKSDVVIRARAIIDEIDLAYAELDPSKMGEIASQAASTFNKEFQSLMASTTSGFMGSSPVDWLSDGKLSEAAAAAAGPMAESFANSLTLGIQSSVENQSDRWVAMMDQSAQLAVTAFTGTRIEEQLAKAADIIRNNRIDMSATGISLEDLQDIETLTQKYLALNANQRSEFQAMDKSFKEFGKTVEFQYDILARSSDKMFAPEIQEQIGQVTSKIMEAGNGISQYQASILAMAQVTDTEFAGAIKSIQGLVKEGDSLNEAFFKLSNFEGGTQAAESLEPILPFIQAIRSNLQAMDLDETEIDIDEASLLIAQAQIEGIMVDLAELENNPTEHLIDIRTQIDSARSIRESLNAMNEIAEIKAASDQMKAASAVALEEEAEQSAEVIQEASDEAYKAEKKNSDAKIKDAEKESQNKIKFVEKALSDEEKLRKKAFDQQIDAAQEAIKQAEKQRKAQIDAVRDEYDARLKAIEDEEKARERAFRDEERRQQRAKELRDLQLKMMEGVATGNAFNVLAAQLEMRSAQEGWNKEDEERVASDQAEAAKLAIQEERDAKIAAMEEAAERQKQLDEEALNRQKELGNALLEQFRLQNEEKMNQFKEAESAKIEFLKTAEQDRLDAMQEASRKAVENAQQTTQSLLAEEEIKKVEIVKRYDEIQNRTKELNVQTQGDIEEIVATLQAEYGELGMTAALATQFAVGQVKGWEGAVDELIQVMEKATVSGLRMGAVLEWANEPGITVAEMEKRLQLLTSNFYSLANEHSNRQGLITPQKKADGGKIVGPGTKTSDSVPILGSNGEYMIRAAMVDKYGVSFFDMINAGRFANGGLVGTSSSSSRLVSITLTSLGQLKSANNDIAMDSDNELTEKQIDNIEKVMIQNNIAQKDRLTLLSILQRRQIEVDASGISSNDQFNRAIQNNDSNTLAKKMQMLSALTQESGSADRAMIDSMNARSLQARLALDLIERKNSQITLAMITQWAAWSNEATKNIELTGEALVDTFTNINYDAMIKMVDAYASGNQNEGDKFKGEILRRAYGGYVSGPGTATSDSIPARLSNGEFVMRQRAVQKYGVSFMKNVNEGRFADGGLVGSITKGISSNLNSAIEQRIQRIIDTRSMQFSTDGEGNIVDWSKIPSESYGYPFSGGTTYSGGNHGIDGTGAIDFGAPQAPFGAAIRPAGPGYVVVKSTGFPDIGRRSDGGGGGNWLYVNHVIDGKPYTSVYMHMKQGSTKVKTGDLVSRKDILGQVGASGHVIPEGIRGSHLHFEFAPGHGTVGAQQTRKVFPSTANAYNSTRGFPLVMGGPGLMSFVASKPMSGGLTPNSWNLKSGAPNAASDPSGTPLADFSWSNATFPGVSSNVSRWANVVSAAMTQLGIPQQFLYGILRQMQQESGGNPNAINDWDINWKNGIPSKGLMQVILPTFMKYAPQGRNTAEFHTDPFANIFAGINYAKSRYGMDKFGSWNSGMNQAYAAGGLVIPALRSGGTIMYDNTLANLHRGETVLTAPLTNKLKDGVSDVANSGQIHYTVNVNIDRASATASEIESAVHSALRKSQREIGVSRVVGRN